MRNGWFLPRFIEHLVVAGQSAINIAAARTITRLISNQIVAMDWGKGVAVVEAAAGGMSVVHFDPKTLQMH